MSKEYIFSLNNYESNDGMMTSIWGPPFWHILHILSFNYPITPNKKQKKSYYKFFYNLKNILPCKSCRDNLVKNYEILPLTSEVFISRDSLSRYVYNLHELINTMLHKKSKLTFEDVRDRYEQFRSRCLINPNKNINDEKGCIDSLYGIKTKCVLSILPNDKRIKSFKIDKKCQITNKNK